MTAMDTAPRTRVVGGFLVRLLGYYLLVTIALMALVRVFPGFSQMLSLDFEAASGGGFGRDALRPPSVLNVELGRALNTVLLGALSMIGGLVFAIPVAWTYTETKRDEGFDKSIVQIIIMLPLAVGGVVLLVRGELALAFALAGIVAAIRFRTTFKDVKDAVFAFVVIGIGLASGMQALLLAEIFSLVFCLVVLGLWRFEVGEVREEAGQPAGPMTLSEALTPGDAEEPVLMGDPVLTAPLENVELEAVRDRASRLQQYVRAEALRDKQKYKHLLLVYAADAEEAEDTVEELLEDYAKRWSLVETLEGRSGVQILEYLVRFKKTVDLREFLDRLLADDEDLIRAIELKSMKEMRQ